MLQVPDLLLPDLHSHLPALPLLSVTLPAMPQRTLLYILTDLFLPVLPVLFWVFLYWLPLLRLFQLLQSLPPEVLLPLQSFPALQVFPEVYRLHPFHRNMLKDPTEPEGLHQLVRLLRLLLLLQWPLPEADHGSPLLSFLSLLQSDSVPELLSLLLSHWSFFLLLWSHWFRCRHHKLHCSVL